MRNIRVIRIVSFMVFSVFITLSLSTVFVMAQEKYPTKPITVVVGYAAGGATDVTARAFSKAVENVVKQPLLVINKPGAATAVAMQYVKNSPPDGYTLGISGTGSILGKHFTQVPFDYFEDFTHLCQYVSLIAGFVVHPDSPWKSMQEFVEYARKNPGKIKYGAFERGTHGHLEAEAFAALNGIKWVPVPFPGDLQALAACMGKHVDACLASIQSLTPLVRAEKLRLLAFFEERHKSFPDVPQVRELGYEFPVDFRGFYGLLAPKGITAEIKDTLLDAFRKAWKDPQFQNVMSNMSMPTCYREGDELIRYYREYDKECQAIMKRIGLK